jgi:hypothetical protein
MTFRIAGNQKVTTEEAKKTLLEAMENNLHAPWCATTDEQGEITAEVQIEKWEDVGFEYWNVAALEGWKEAVIFGAHSAQEAEDKAIKFLKEECDTEEDEIHDGMIQGATLYRG